MVKRRGKEDESLPNRLLALLNYFYVPITTSGTKRVKRSEIKRLRSGNGVRPGSHRSTDRKLHALSHISHILY